MTAAADYLNRHHGYVRPRGIARVFRGAVQAHIPTRELRLRLNHGITDEDGWRLMPDELALDRSPWQANFAAREKMTDALIRLAFLHCGVDAYRVISGPSFLRRRRGNRRQGATGLALRGPCE